ncbi:MAG TPA: hypothetical protein VLI72_11970 [Methylibium sp.]|nr:hypothetical protein [Methylibium sp.]
MLPLLVVGVVMLWAGIEPGLRLLGLLLLGMAFFYALRAVLPASWYAPSVLRLDGAGLLVIVGVYVALGAICLLEPGFVMHFVQVLRHGGRAT